VDQILPPKAGDHNNTVQKGKDYAMVLLSRGDVSISLYSNQIRQIWRLRSNDLPRGTLRIVCQDGMPHAKCLPDWRPSFNQFCDGGRGCLYRDMRNRSP